MKPGHQSQRFSIPDVPHTATGSYDTKGDDIMRHHQKTVETHRPK